MSYQNVSLTKYLMMIADTKPTPGGGSVAAYAGALGAALAEMVISLTLRRAQGGEPFGSELRAELQRRTALKKKPGLPRFYRGLPCPDSIGALRNYLKHFHQTGRILARLSELDSRAYDDVCAAYRAQNQTDLQKKKRTQRIQKAMKQAADIPGRTLKICFANLQLMNQLINLINRNAITDLGVGILLTQSAFTGCKMNVEVNLKYIKDKNFTGRTAKEMAGLEKKSNALFKNTIRQVRGKIK
ncbi:MAG: cyclodeaminase/cyclohydrolase family protein [Planctomycetota bacterium]